MSIRGDLKLIDRWLKKGSSVLDLGCGDGTLLAHFGRTKNIKGYGLEIDPEQITQCIQNGVNVIEHDLDKQDLSRFAARQFDVVLMTQALQATRRPDLLLDEMLRLGDEGIVTFPNFGHWRCRFYLMFKGKMPMSETLPHQWYNTPNIHLCTFSDFEKLCQDKNIRILDRRVVNAEFESDPWVSIWPNLLAEFAVYRVTRK